MIEFGRPNRGQIGRFKNAFWMGALVFLFGSGDSLLGYQSTEKTKTKLNGYLERIEDGHWHVEGQRVRASANLKFKGKTADRSLSSMEETPLGFEVKVEGYRQSDGVVVAEKLEVKPNGSAMFESEVLDATNQLEAAFRQSGQMIQSAAEGEMMSLGDLEQTGPRVDRVRRITDRLLPPYLAPEDLRVYVVDNEEWNAMAMGNYSIYVFSGLMEDTDDDELAIVLGHELAHASHEHTRRQQKKNMWINLAAAGTQVVLSEIDAADKQAIAGAVAGLSLMAWTNGYSRDLEDQADQVGLRYAYEGGFDVSKGPRLWERFSERYGESDSVSNFFYGSHSRSSDRAKNLYREIGYNYGSGRKTRR